MRGVSKRHLRRLIKKEKDVFSSKLLSNSVAQLEATCSSVNAQCHDEGHMESSDIGNTFEQKFAYDIIMKSLAEQKVLTERVLHQEVTNNNACAVFPIKSVNDLHDFNTIISEDNRDLYVNRMKALLKGRLAKTLTDVISQSVCIEINLDGVHGKKRLKDFKAFYQTLMDACRSLGFEDNEKEIRNALKIIKKRHFHAECIKNKKNKTEN
ncbi:uncharacterized protein LOC126766444 isoform X1 [Bactrocera neohumeralis]|uniref:uncharacterized protein LOC120779699 n=1 Tax=Bactrocera tryoni TaxID=59916 RepID=UPI001A9685AE|nr:uncharacterized protein LOC120779699 [Bactrocera tryoni]XP_050340178.1 uncharacterized protein LOC126766444 isoform X1 [Bactrocera neohumeralis]